MDLLDTNTGTIDDPTTTEFAPVVETPEAGEVEGAAVAEATDGIEGVEELVSDPKTV